MRASGGNRRLAAVQALLTDLYGVPVAVEGWERLEPWAVARVLLGGAGARTAVVKWVRDGPARVRSEPWRLRAELAALQFLSDDLGLALAPRVIAADVRAGLLVMEDLAPRVALDRLIRRDGAAAHPGLLAVFARACGELGAATAGQAGTYHARCAAAGLTAVAGGGREGRLAGLWDHGHRDAAALGTPITGPAASELSAALGELNAPGPFLALSHGDAGANNIMVCEHGPASARLIDFEAAGYAHALTDAVCLHVPGPGWICVGDPGGLADQYRRALAEGVPQAQDDRRYGFALASACLSWALLRLRRLAVLDARAPGDHSRLQLVETLESAARTAQAHRALPCLAGWARRAADALRRRWPDADLDLADQAKFPPYSPRQNG